MLVPTLYTYWCDLQNTMLCSLRSKSQVCLVAGRQLRFVAKCVFDELSCLHSTAADLKSNQRITYGTQFALTSRRPIRFPHSTHTHTLVSNAKHCIIILCFTNIPLNSIVFNFSFMHSAEIKIHSVYNKSIYASFTWKTICAIYFY